MKHIVEERKKVVGYYDSHLDFDSLKRMKLREGTEWNYSYYPVIFENEAQLLKVQQELNDNSIFPRRYFYPSLNTIDYVKAPSMTIAENIASRILCLPLYVGLQEKELENICKIINQNVF